MRTKQEEKLRAQLAAYKQAFHVERQKNHVERQKNRDMSQSRDRYKVKVKRLTQALKAAESVKKNGKSECLPSSTLNDISTLISLFR
jgi:hypothetical protein